MDAPGLILYELAGADPALRFSPHCWKTRMALAHKGLDATCVPWRFTETERIAFSGQALVPVLVNGDEAVSDSWRIARYLEDHFPGLPSLFGGQSAVPLTRFVNRWADMTLVPAITRVILLDIYERLDERDRDYFRASREARLGASLEAVVSGQPAHLGSLRLALRPVRQEVKDKPFLCGDAPGYADYCVFGMFMWARCTSPVELLDDDDPLVAWRERLLDAFAGMARNAPSAQDDGAHRGR
jgi:glutathione S-transferase